MKPAVQCEYAAKKGFAALGMISRGFHYRSKSTLLPLYKTFVRPKLEYAVAAWAPWTEKDKGALEAVQQRMVRMVTNVRGDSYEEKLADLGITTLEERRRRGDLIEAFKTVKGINKVDKHTWFPLQMVEAGRMTRKNAIIVDGDAQRSDVMEKVRFQKDVCKNFYSVRVADGWNGLPAEVRDQKSVNAFKNALDRYVAKEKLLEQNP